MANSSKPGALYDWDVIQKLRASGLNWAQTAEEMGYLPSTLRSAVRRRRDYLNSLATQEIDMRATLVGVGLEMLLAAKTKQPNADNEYALKWADFLARISGAYAPAGPSQLSQTNVQLPTQIILMPADAEAPAVTVDEPTGQASLAPGLEDDDGDEAETYYYGG